MNPTLKAFLINAAKNAVNAALLSLAQVYHNPSAYNFTSALGLWNIGKFIVVPAIAIREGLVYAPKLLASSQTSDAPAPKP
jgi:hypothetical protein